VAARQGLAQGLPEGQAGVMMGHQHQAGGEIRRAPALVFQEGPDGGNQGAGHGPILKGGRAKKKLRSR
jgi:hypothetical protein